LLRSDPAHGQFADSLLLWLFLTLFAHLRRGLVRGRHQVAGEAVGEGEPVGEGEAAGEPDGEAEGDGLVQGSLLFSL
jgi:hypothetical protein